MMNNITPVVKQLIIINVIFFIGSQILHNGLAYELFSMHNPESIKFKFWQPLTTIFMHADFMHLFFNMFALFSFGVVLEQIWGGNKFLFFYISCGLGAKLLSTSIDYLQIHYLLNSVSDLHLSNSDLKVLLNSDLSNVFDDNGKMVAGNFQSILEKVKCTQEQYNLIEEANLITKSTSLGASGAIYGLLVAFAFMFPNAEMFMMFIPIPIKAKYYIIGILLLDLFLGLNGQSLFGRERANVGYFAHLGGALLGFIMMWIWRKNQFKHNRWN